MINVFHWKKVMAVRDIIHHENGKDIPMKELELECKHCFWIEPHQDAPEQIDCGSCREEERKGV